MTRRKAASAALLLTAVTLTAGSSVLRKDKAAALLYGGMLEQNRLIARADSANLLDILLLRTRGGAVSAPADLAGRPCYGIALFTLAEWARLGRDVRESSDIDPRLAATRFRFYPAVGDLPPVVELPAQPGQTSEAWVALGVGHAPWLKTSVATPDSQPPECNEQL
ncbi:MAG: hypothetical protein WEF86_16555 [Gemmatimonadota bacterium]